MIRKFWASGPLLLTITVLFWSGNFVLGRYIRNDVTPISLAFWRWTIAFLILLPFAFRRLKTDAPALRKQWLLVTFLAFLGVALFNTLVYLALHTTTVINGVLLQSAMPLLILAASFLLFKERVRTVQVIAILVSLLGVVAIVTKLSIEAIVNLTVATGDVLIFIAVVGYALYTALLRRRPRIHPLSFLVTIIGLGAAMLLPLYVWEQFTTTTPFRLTPILIAAIAYVAVCPSILSYLFFNRAVELIGANHAGQFLHLAPVFGSVLAWIFLDERLALYHLVGAALIGAGILLANLMRPRQVESVKA